MRRGENTFHKGLWELKIVNPFSWLRYVAGVWVMEGVGNTHNCLVPGQSMTCRNSEMMQSDMQPHWQRYSKTDYRFVFLCSRTRCTNPMKLPHWWSHLCSDLCSPWLLDDMRRLWKGKSINQRSFRIDGIYLSLWEKWANVLLTNLLPSHGSVPSVGLLSNSTVVLFAPNLPYLQSLT